MAFLDDLANVTDDATTSMVAALQCYDATSRSGPRHRPRGMGIGRTPPRCHQSERPPGTGTLPDVMIYKEGGCQFGAVQAVVEAAPEHSAGRYVIYIKEGVYEEMVRVPFKKRNLTVMLFVLDLVDEESSITGSLSRAEVCPNHTGASGSDVIDMTSRELLLGSVALVSRPPRLRCFWRVGPGHFVSHHSLPPDGGLPESCYKSQEISLLVFGAFVGVGLIFAIVFKGIFDGILLGNVVETRSAGRLVEARKEVFGEAIEVRSKRSTEASLGEWKKSKVSDRHKSSHDGEKSKTRSAKGKRPNVSTEPRSKPQSIRDLYRANLGKDGCDYHVIRASNQLECALDAPLEIDLAPLMHRTQIWLDMRFQRIMSKRQRSLS
ncbi:hypothetical protein B296_00020413 [Ensete ventricosum]|uniref:Pectinesterase catalytic domain-containing protein n=1 Tax=Ensete ventricosum TaxID=4639 RepID=A0A427AJP5_ENSVE|nr:hypothetical protein B296_00020413 [Ensete ventricosum]